jgi:hypothetical protein
VFGPSAGTQRVLITHCKCAKASSNSPTDCAPRLLRVRPPRAPSGGGHARLFAANSRCRGLTRRGTVRLAQCQPGDARNPRLAECAAANALTDVACTE